MSGFGAGKLANKGCFSHKSPCFLVGFVGLVHVGRDAVQHRKYGREVFCEVASGKYQCWEWISRMA